MNEDNDLQLTKRRQAALAELLKEHADGNQTKFAGLIGVSKNAVTRWVSTEYGTPRHRNIKAKHCRAMERQFNKDKYWMDNYGRKPETESSAIKEVFNSYLERMTPAAKIEALDAVREIALRDSQQS